MFTAQEKLKLREDNEKLHSKLIETRNKCNEVVQEKTELARCMSTIHFYSTSRYVFSALITSEEERLRISKTLIDLQIENNRVKEEAEAKSFDDV